MLAHLRRALHRLRRSLGPLSVAPLYRTAPVSPHPQPPYLNTAAVGTTRVPPEDVLALAKALEAEAGRDFSAPRWSARPLDVDLLVYGDRVEAGEGSGTALTLPHPRLHERAFVLVPLARVAPDLPVPPAGRTVEELLTRLRAEPRRHGEAAGSGDEESEEIVEVAPAGWDDEARGPEAGGEADDGGDAGESDTGGKEASPGASRDR